MVGPSIEWREETLSPRVLPRFPASVPDAMGKACGTPDEALTRTAEWLLKVHMEEGLESSEADLMTFAIRAFGGGFSSARNWSITWTGPTPQTTEFASQLATWWNTAKEPGAEYCGLAWVETATGGRLMAIGGSSLAEMTRPFPTSARTGQWMELAAIPRVSVTEAKVVALGPSGEPITFGATVGKNGISARFPAKSPGSWEIQLVGSTAAGPRTLLRAVLNVDSPPPARFAAQTAPGEDAAGDTTSPGDALGRMVGELRRLLKRGTLTRRPELDRVAQAHAEAMRTKGELVHDLGQGSLTERLERAGIGTLMHGENVARAANIVRVHRVLWASPSHRANLIDSSFADWGLGVAADGNGQLWVCEVFAKIARP
jgi:uncharacterized protein YkwD